MNRDRAGIDLATLLERLPAPNRSSLTEQVSRLLVAHSAPHGEGADLLNTDAHGVDLF